MKRRSLNLMALMFACSFLTGLGCQEMNHAPMEAREPLSMQGMFSHELMRPPSFPTTPKLEGADILWVNPRLSDAGPMKLVFVSWEEIPSDVRVEVLISGESYMASPKFFVEGPPYGALFEIKAVPGPGIVRARVYVGELLMEGVELKAQRRLDMRFATYKEAWPVERQWDDSMELLYSVWVAKLFKMPKKTPGGWRPLHQVTRNRERNFLYGTMSWDEDRFSRNGPAAVTMRGDCADVPYLLRAYFAWKMGLPVRFRQCTRGSGRRGPRCYDVNTNLMEEYAQIDDPVMRFNAFVRKEIVWKVHSGTIRTLPEDEESDLFPIDVNRRELIPGAVYVDAGGHALVVTHVGENDLTAIDGHPDMSITIRKFSQRKFFPVYTRLQTGGFKAFRPIYTEKGKVHTVDNKGLGERFSRKQYGFESKSSYYSFVERRLSSDLKVSFLGFVDGRDKAILQAGK